MAVRYFNGAATTEDEETLFQFVKQSVDNKRLFRQWEAEWMASPRIQPETDREWERLRQRIAFDASSMRKSRGFYLHRIGWMAAAAVAGVLLVVGSYWGTMNYAERVADNNLFALHTERAEKTRLLLADGTTVYLNAGSTLQYSANFNHRNREVVLSGEAYFEVTRQPGDIPFTVRTDACEVTVKGTRFNVTAYPEEETVRTVLIQGAVEMATTDTIVAIQPGELLTLNKENGRFTKETVQAEQYKAWTEGRFVYDRISLRELVNRLSRKYDVDIELDDRIQADVVFRISLRNEETIDDILNALTQLVPVHYEKVGRHIRIY